MPLSPRADQVSTVLFQNLSGLAACVCDSIDPVCRCDVVVGDQHYTLTGPESDCDDCGEAWVRVTSIAPLINQQPSFGGETCFQSLALVLDVGVLRCMPVPEHGEAPDGPEMAAVALQQSQDIVGAQGGILCCDHFDDMRLLNYQPTTEGNLMGGIWQVQVAF